VAGNSQNAKGFDVTEITLKVIERIREDIQTVFAKDPAAKTTWEVICCYPGLHAIWLHRVAHFLWEHKLLFLGRLVSHINRWLTGVEIHPGAKIGRRFFVDHGMGVVIGETAEIGDDVLLYQGVVLGGTTMEKTKRHPTIGSNVVIGAGAVVLGPITVGDNAKIGAGSVVIRPVAAGATVVGVPARVAGRPEPTRRADLEHGRLPDPVVKAISELLAQQSQLQERVRQLEKALLQLEPSALALPVRPPAAAAVDLAQCIREALQEVIDPEAGVSVVELGLIHNIEVDGEQVRIRVFIPTPECPFIEYLLAQIQHRTECINGIKAVEVTLLDEPRSSDVLSRSNRRESTVKGPV
jgi:serine O-acetyltransferase